MKKTIILALLLCTMLTGCASNDAPQANTPSLDDTTISDTTLSSTTSSDTPSLNDPVVTTSSTDSISTSTPIEDTSSTTTITDLNPVPDTSNPVTAPSLDIPDEDAPSSTTTTNQTEAPTIMDVDGDLLSGTTSRDFNIKIVGLSRIKEQGKNVLIVEYEVKNNGSSASFNSRISDTVYQGLSKCNDFTDSEFHDRDLHSKNISNGEKLVLRAAYELYTMDETVAIIIENAIDCTDNYIINILVDKDNKYTMCKSLEMEQGVSYRPVPFANLKGYGVTEQTPTIELMFDISHYEDNPVSFAEFTNLIVKQNGQTLELLDVKNIHKKLIPGTENEIRVVYKLIDNTSDVNILIEEANASPGDALILEDVIKLTD